MVASIIVSKYSKSIMMDQLMIVRAIKTNQMFFLQSVWGYNKNYTRIWTHEDEDKDVLSDESGYESTNSQGEFERRKTEGRYKTYTYDFLIK